MARKQTAPDVGVEGKSLGRDGRVQLLGECDWVVSEGSRMNKGEHGTATRYGQAIRVGATPCQKCKTANTQADLAYRARRQAQASLVPDHELDEMTVAQLRAFAEAAGLELPMRARKAKLVEAIRISS